MLERIYASKMFRSSKNKDHIRAAVSNPVNAELVKQLSSYLDLPEKDDENENKVTEDVKEVNTKDTSEETSEEVNVDVKPEHKISDHLFFLLCPSILSSPKTLFINQTSLNCGRNFRSFPAAGPPLISSRSSEHTGLSCQPFSLWRRAPDSAPGGESCAAGCFLVHPGIISMFSIVKFA